MSLQDLVSTSFDLRKHTSGAKALMCAVGGGTTEEVLKKSLVRDKRPLGLKALI